MEDSKNKDISVSHLAKLEHEIVRFDSVLEQIQKLFPSDVRVWDFISNTRDCIFWLQQSLHGLDIIDSTSDFERPCWWVEDFVEEAKSGEEGGEASEK